jgi:hypothetical protein
VTVAKTLALDRGDAKLADALQKVLLEEQLSLEQEKGWRTIICGASPDGGCVRCRANRYFLGF